MKPATPSNIEAYLFEKGGWVSVEQLSTLWDVGERALRRAVAGVAVAGERGYIHYYHATPDDLEAYSGPKWAHAKGEMRNLLRLRRNHRLHRIPALVDDAGQALLL